MKRSILAASLVSLAVFVVPEVASAKLSHSEAVAYGRAYVHVQHQLGLQVAGCRLIGPHATCRKASDRKVKASTAVLHRMLAPAPAPTPAATAAPQAPAPTATAASSATTGGYSSVPGVPSSFAACVALRESTNGAGSSNVYGIVGSGGQGSIAEQKAAFSRMYQARGTQPWSQWDHCG